METSNEAIVQYLKETHETYNAQRKSRCHSPHASTLPLPHVMFQTKKISTQFAEELQLMSTLHHPNIVLFLGVYFFPVPALVMVRLLTSFHDLLDPETNDVQPPPAQLPPTEPTPLSFFTLGLKCSILHNVASGLAYLHGRTPPIIH